MPADWFPAETHPLLVQLCRHLTIARLLGRTLAEEQSLQTADGLRRLANLCNAPARGGSDCVDFDQATLTVQSRYKAERAATIANNAPTGRRPWELV
jgi:hypothetical protein